LSHTICSLRPDIAEIENLGETMTTTITQAPSNTLERFHLVPTKFGRKITLTAPTVVSFYEGIGTAEDLKAYYKNTIVPWLKAQYDEWGTNHPGAPYPLAVYLMDMTLVVFAGDTAYEVWESIPDFAQHFKEKVDAEKLDSPKTPEKSGYAA
jgi:hypothetical protein